MAKQVIYYGSYCKIENPSYIYECYKEGKVL